MYTIRHKITGVVLHSSDGKPFSFDNYSDAKAAVKILGCYEVAIL